MHLGQGDVEECIAEIKTLYQLAAHVSKGPTLLEELIAHRLISNAFDGLVSVCASEKADSKQLEDLLQWVGQIKTIDDAGTRVDQTDRFIGLEAILNMSRVDTSAGVFVRFVDWEETFLILNANYDRFVEVAKISDFSEFEVAHSELVETMIENESWVMESRLQSALMGRKSKGIWTGKMLSGMLMPAIEGVVESENQIKAKQRMLQIVIAASIFKKNEKRFPKSLSELAPQYLNDIPSDPLTGQPFVYQEIENGIKIHSTKLDSQADSVSTVNRLLIELEKVSWSDFAENLRSEELEYGYGFQ